MYLMAAGCEHLMAFVSPVTPDDQTFLFHFSKASSLTIPMTLGHLEDLQEPVQWPTDDACWITTEYLINPTYWVFDGPDVVICRRVHPAGAGVLMHLFHDRNQIPWSLWKESMLAELPGRQFSDWFQQARKQPH
jgi:hypothetical protein